MADPATIFLRDWLNKNRDKSLNHFLEEKANSPDFHFSDKPALSKLGVRLPNYRRKNRVASCAKNMPRSIQKSPGVTKALQQWKPDPHGLIFTTENSRRLAIKDLPSLYDAAKHVNELEYGFHNSILCLLIFRLGARTNRLSASHVVARLQEIGTRGDEKEIKRFVTEKWQSGRRLQFFCLGLLHNIGTALVLPQDVATLVKDIGPIYQKSVDLFHPIIQSLRDACIDDAVSDNETQQLLQIIDALSSTQLLCWTSDLPRTIANRECREASKVSKNRPNSAKRVPNRAKRAPNRAMREAKSTTLSGSSAPGPYEFSFNSNLNARSGSTAYFHASNLSLTQENNANTRSNPEMQSFQYTQQTPTNVFQMLFDNPEIQSYHYTQSTLPSTEMLLLSNPEVQPLQYTQQTPTNMFQMLLETPEVQSYHYTQATLQTTDIPQPPINNLEVQSYQYTQTTLPQLPPTNPETQCHLAYSTDVPIRECQN